MNVPQGSVVVTSGGMILTENVDYTGIMYSEGLKLLIRDCWSQESQ